MKALGNILWVLLGGFVIAFEYLIASILLMITIVGIPFGIQALKMADIALWPFGRDTRTTEHTSGGLPTLFNLLWILVGGFWIFLTHLILGLLCTITIIGIPLPVNISNWHRLP